MNSIFQAELLRLLVGEQLQARQDRGRYRHPAAGCGGRAAGQPAGDPKADRTLRDPALRRLFFRHGRPVRSSAAGRHPEGEKALRCLNAGGGLPEGSCTFCDRAGCRSQRRQRFRAASSHAGGVKNNGDGSLSH